MLQRRGREPQSNWHNLCVACGIFHHERIRPWHRIGSTVLVAFLLLASCGTAEEATEPAGSEPTSLPENERLSGDDNEPAERLPTIDPSAPKPDPVPFQPAGAVGSAEAYSELLSDLANDVPAELQDEIPWPDLRNPDPIVVQIEIFDLWIWMAEHHPEPALVEVMAAPGSPSREEIVSIFGSQQSAGTLRHREGAPYVAYDHQVITFASAGLPLWLARDVPEDAVVVYYSDKSGGVTVTDRETGEVLNVTPAVDERAWLSIMVPTDVGWQLWRDQLIEPNDAELQTPEVPPPGESDDRRKPEL